MARRSLPTFDLLWNRHVSLYTEIFSSALSQLTKKQSVVGDEDAISESLNPILRQLCFKINSDGKQEVRTPLWEYPQQPVIEHELTGGKKGNRPDFTCPFYNSSASLPEDMEIPFHVECKRLGNPTSRTWNLNKNYLVKGMKRFDSPEQEYGKRASAGLMIGYIISLCPCDIAAEINKHKNLHFSNWPDIKFPSNNEHVHRTEQQIIRQNVTPTRFSLIHIWADIRHNYKPSTNPKPKVI